MRISMVTFMFVLALCIGCAHVNSETHRCQIRVANRSSQPIRSVTIDPDGSGTDFGFLSGGTRGKSAAGCFLRFSSDLPIEWEEHDKTRRSAVDLSIYIGKRKDIEGVSFYYLGDGRWQVIARSGTDEASPEVEP